MHAKWVIALTGGELVYFEMDATGQLNEYTERKEMASEVICMGLARVPAGEQRSRFLAVGLVDNTVRVMSLDPADCLSPLSMQALPDTPESLCLVEMGGGGETRPGAASGGEVSSLYLNIGLHNGVLLRAVLDKVSGDLSDSRTRYLGTRPVKLFRIAMQGAEAVLAVSSRSWLSYTYQSRFHLTPLSYEMLEHASGFSSEQCPEGIVAISANTLRILALEKLGAVFNQVAFPLSYTPRRFVLHPPSGQLVVLETDHNAYTEEMRAARKRQMAAEMVEAAGAEEQELAREMAAAFLAEALPEAVFGAPKAGAGMWASAIRVMDPLTGATRQLLSLPQNEAAHSIALVRFANRLDEPLLVVGTVKDLVLQPRGCSGGALRTYRLVQPAGGSSTDPPILELLHETPVEEMPGALHPFQGRLLAGIGRVVRIYELGKRKLLRKCENKHIPNLVVGISSVGPRILVFDVQESVHWMRYRRAENQLTIIADDTHPRWMSAFAPSTLTRWLVLINLAICLYCVFHLVPPMSWTTTRVARAPCGTADCLVVRLKRLNYCVLFIMAKRALLCNEPLSFLEAARRLCTRR